MREQPQAGFFRLARRTADFFRVSRRWRPQTALVMALAWALAPATAGGDRPPWEAPAFAADPAELHRAATALASNPEDDVLVVREDASYVFDAHGRCTRTWRIVFRVLTQDGAENWSEVSAGWEPWHQQKPVIRARVITSDGSLHWLDEASWYVFGRIAEQYGEFESAASAYRRLKAPAKDEDSPSATYYLAKKRLDVLEREKKIEPQ